jgi:hypothetical protein
MTSGFFQFHEFNHYLALLVFPIPELYTNVLAKRSAPEHPKRKKMLLLS